MTGDAARREDKSTSEGASTMPSEPSPLEVAAIGLHESFLAYTAAGFTEDQALELIAKIVRPAGRN